MPVKRLIFLLKCGFFPDNSQFAGKQGQTVPIMKRAETGPSEGAQMAPETRCPRGACHGLDRANRRNAAASAAAPEI